MNIRRRILEARDVNVYKLLIKVLGGYSTTFPNTGVSRLFDIAIESGKKILPTDKQALNILCFILSNDSEPAAVTKLLNIRFSDLPAEYKPYSKQGNRHEVASWERNGIITDRIKDLVDFDDTGSKGKWSNIDGEAVTLVDLSQEE